MQQINLSDVLALLGQKEVELAILRQKLAEAEAQLTPPTPKEK